MKRYGRLLRSSFIPVYGLAGSLLLFSTRGFGQAQENPLELSQAPRVIGIAIAVIGVLAYLSRRNMRLPKPDPVLKVYGSYILVGLISSVLFSEWLTYSLWKLLEVFAVLIVAWYLIVLIKKGTAEPRNVHGLSILYIKMLLLSILVGAIINPGAAFISNSTSGTALLSMQLNGYLLKINPNSGGLLFAIVTYVSLLRVMKGWKTSLVSQDFVWLMFGVVGVVLSQSRTSMVALGVVMIVSMLGFRGAGKTSRVALIIMIGAMLFLFWEVVASFLMRGQHEELLLSMSGRTFMWQHAFETLDKKPIVNWFLGMGFASASQFIMEDYGSGASTLHSDYIDVLVSTGIIGVILLCMFIFLCLRKAGRLAMRNKSDLLVWEASGIMGMIILRSITGTSLALHNYFLVLFMLALVVLYGIDWQRNGRGRLAGTSKY